MSTIHRSGFVAFLSNFDVFCQKDNCSVVTKINDYHSIIVMLKITVLIIKDQITAKQYIGQLGITPFLASDM
jgi:hypothetical protein